MIGFEEWQSNRGSCRSRRTVRPARRGEIRAPVVVSWDQAALSMETDAARENGLAVHPGRAPSFAFLTSEAVESPLKNEGGRHFIHEVYATLPRRIGIEKRPCDGDRRKPFVTKGDWERRSQSEV